MEIRWKTDTLGSTPPDYDRPGLRYYGWFFGASLVLSVVAMQFDALMADPKSLDSFPGDLRRVVKLSETFAHGFGIVLIGSAIWLLAPKKRRFLPRVLGCAILPSFAVHMIKLFVGRHRPLCLVLPDRSTNFPRSSWDTFIGWGPDFMLNIDHSTQSFPSAHAATVFGMAIGLSWLFPRGRVLFFSVAVLASLQRITSLAHWSSDVCIGAALGFLIAGELTHNRGLGYCLGRWENRSSSSRDMPTAVDLEP